MTAPIDTALALARSVLGRTNPNPAVGCVLVNAQGEVIGQGATQPVGGPHAEVMALRDAQAHGHGITGATAYVTLEPCAHHGRTGPCCDALIAAGIQRVVASLADPNPLVAGQGFARLRAAGVAVEVGPGEQQARELNLGFLQRMTHGLPWVRMKVAASLDGRTALPDGTSQWITDEAARTDGHRWRARACAILTGVGTVLADDPRLDVRLPAGEDTPARRPRRVIVDSSLRTPPSARLLAMPGPVLIYTTVDNPARHAPLLARGAEIAVLPANGNGRVDLPALLRDLGQRATNEVHVEAGGVLNGALLRQELVDDCLVYLAPRFLGNGLEMASLGTLDALNQAPTFDFVDVAPVGTDLRLIARARRHRSVP